MNMGKSNCLNNKDYVPNGMHSKKEVKLESIGKNDNLESNLDDSFDSFCESMNHDLSDNTAVNRTFSFIQVVSKNQYTTNVTYLGNVIVTENENEINNLKENGNENATVKDEAESSFEKGCLAQAEENWKEAEINFINALKSFKIFYKYDSLLHSDKFIINIEIGNCYFKLGLIYEKYKNYQKSEDYYLTALEIYKNVHSGEENNYYCASAYFNLGGLRELNNEKLNALDYFMLSKNILKKIKPKDEDYIDILIRLGSIYQELTNIDEAIVYFEEALNLILENNKCNNLNALLDIFIKEVNMEKINTLLEISFALSKIYIESSYLKYADGLLHFKIVLCLMPASREFFDETFELLKRYIDLTDIKKDNHKYDKDLSDCLKFFSGKLESERDQNDNKFTYSSATSAISLNEISHNNLLNIKDASHKTNTSSVNKYFKNKTDANYGMNENEVGNSSNYYLSVKKIGEIFDFLSRLSSNMEMYKDSIDLAEKSVAFFDKIPKNVSMKLRICDILNNIGIEYNNLGMYQNSLKFFERTLELRIKYSGPDNIKTAGIYNNLAIAYDKLNDYDAAISNWKKCMEIRSKVLPPDDIKIANSYYNYSLILSKIKNYDQALENMLKCIEIYDNKLGKKSQQSADAATCLGDYYKSMNKPLEAVAYLQRAFNYFKVKFGENDTYTLKAKILLGICQSRLKQHDKAVVLLEPALETIKQIQGKQPPSEIVVEMWMELGYCYESAKEYSKGKKTFETLYQIGRAVMTDDLVKELNKKIVEMVT